MLRIVPTAGRIGAFNIFSAYAHAGRCSSTYLARRSLATATEHRSHPVSPPSVPSALTQSDAATTVNTQTGGANSKVHVGDWVLFHPVYTPEELKAVDVSRPLCIYLPCVIELSGIFSGITS
jgi:ubiquinol oxidase